ncbi:MAG: PorP/SprF family type IX secretion system membrane protein, partial [Bacteroidota bacterium]
MKNLLIKIALAVVVIIFSDKMAVAQDYHFSQFDTAPLYTNPAMTGYMIGRNRISLKYRGQWSSVLEDNAYETILVSYDGRTCPSGNISIAYGVNLVKDVFGFPAFQTNHYLGSFATHVKLSNGLMFAGGLQMGLLQFRLDLNGLAFENQFDGFVGFDTSLPSLEAFSDQQPIDLLDIGGGVLLYDYKSGFNLGVGFHHINPFNFYTFSETELQVGNRPNVRWIVHGAFTLFTTSKIAIAPKFMAVIQVPHWQLNVGADFRLTVSKTKNNPFLNGVILGIGSRLSNRVNDVTTIDAVLFSAKTDIAKGILLGFGFDWNVSSLRRSSSSRGGIELSLVVEFGGSDKKKC